MTASAQVLSAQESKVLEQDLKAAGELFRDKEVANSTKKQVKSRRITTKSRHSTDLCNTSSDDESASTKKMKPMDRLCMVLADHLETSRSCASIYLFISIDDSGTSPIGLWNNQP